MNKNCHKVKYATKAEAQDASRNLLRWTGYKTSAYYCEECKNFHIGGKYGAGKSKFRLENRKFKKKHKPRKKPPWKRTK